MLELTLTPPPLTRMYGEPQASSPVCTSSAQYELGKPELVGARAIGV